MVFISPDAVEQGADRIIKTLLPVGLMLIAGSVGPVGDVFHLTESVDAEVGNAVEPAIRERVHVVLSARAILADPERQPGGLRVVSTEGLTRIVEGVAHSVADEDGLIPVQLARRKVVGLAKQSGDGLVDHRSGQFLNFFRGGGRGSVRDADQSGEEERGQGTKDHSKPHVAGELDSNETIHY